MISLYRPCKDEQTWSMAAKKTHRANPKKTTGRLFWGMFCTSFLFQDDPGAAFALWEVESASALVACILG